MVFVKYRATLAELTGKREERIEAQSIKDVLRYINAQYGKQTEKEAKRMLITVDSESILLRDGFKTRLNEDSVVGFFPISGGG
ncbi:MoaD/ThiS family protein [Eubacteriales bacterium OttesenSCG-928-K08]|nr:MoaD/ThiS family protein [Eubacteriales bacterium OttesenSCG-928-K08]